MENGPSVNSSQMQGSLSVEDSASHNDIMMRRMKNRERQRRYRARKRLEADSMKSKIIEQPTTPVAELQPNGVVSNWTSRVHCRRDWKKDARQAHISKNSEVSRNGGTVTVPVPSSESQTLGLSSGTKAELPVQRESQSEISHDIVNYATHRTVPGRRDWKAEARKKKT